MIELILFMMSEAGNIPAVPLGKQGFWELLRGPNGGLMATAAAISAVATATFTSVMFMKYYIPARERGYKSELNSVKQQMADREARYNVEMADIKTRLKKFEDFQDQLFDDHMNSRVGT